MPYVNGEYLTDYEYLDRDPYGRHVRLFDALLQDERFRPPPPKPCSVCLRMYEHVIPADDAHPDVLVCRYCREGRESVDEEWP